jgi:hypothetical protein
MADSPWIGAEADKLYLQSGQFTSTLKTSQSIGAVNSLPTGAEYEGADQMWSGRGSPGNAELYVTSGQFTSTLKDSQTTSQNTFPGDVSFDNVNTIWIGNTATEKIFIYSGQITSTLKDSQDISGVDADCQGCTSDDTNIPWAGSDADKMYLQSGKVTSTLKTSVALGGVDISVRGCSYDGTNSPWAGVQEQRLYLTSGQFTTTIKTSHDTTTVDTAPESVSTNDYVGRIPSAGGDTVTPSVIPLDFFVETPTAVIGEILAIPNVIVVEWQVEAPTVLIGEALLVPSPIPAQFGIITPENIVNGTFLTPSVIPLDFLVETPVAVQTYIATPSVVPVDIFVETPSTFFEYIATPSVVPVDILVETPVFSSINILVPDSISSGARWQVETPILILGGVSAEPSVVPVDVIVETPVAVQTYIFTPSVVPVEVGIISPNFSADYTATPSSLSYKYTINSDLQAKTRAISDEIASILIAWDSTPTDLTTTNLDSIADTSIWQSGEQNDATPTAYVTRISYELVFNAIPVTGDSIVFRWAKGDEAASNEVWQGGIGATEGAITTAASKAEVKASCPIVWEHPYKTNHSTTFRGTFDVWGFGPSWQLLVEANGEALTTGNTIRYRYGKLQAQR